MSPIGRANGAFVISARRTHTFGRFATTAALVTQDAANHRAVPVAAPAPKLSPSVVVELPKPDLATRRPALSYGFGQFDSDGTPITWRYGHPISVALNPADMAYPHFVRDAAQAIKKINLVGAFRLRLIGHDGSRLDEAAIIIRWVPRSATATPDCLGEAITRIAGSDGKRQIVAAEVRLCSAVKLGAGFKPRAWGVTILHEILHALGVGHCDDPDQVMFPRAQRAADLGVGDRYALRLLQEAARQRSQAVPQ